MTMSGGCQCGAVRYRAEGAPLIQGLCHCRICQLTLGASVSAFASVADDHFRYTKGEPTIYRSSPSAKREYIEWLIDAKQDATREKRLATAVEWIAEGKGRNWKYEKC